MSNITLGKWISLLYRYGRIYMAAELKPYHIGKGQFLFLIALYHKDGLPQEELADSLNINKGTTARAVQKLEENGYVIKRTNPKDLRSNQIFLTQKAKEFKPRLYEILSKWTEILSKGMTEKEIEMAFSLMAKMADNAANYIEANRDLQNEGR